MPWIIVICFAIVVGCLAAMAWELHQAQLRLKADQFCFEIARQAHLTDRNKYWEDVAEFNRLRDEFENRVRANSIITQDREDAPVVPIDRKHQRSIVRSKNLHPTNWKDPNDTA